MNKNLPHYRLQRVFADGFTTEPLIVPVVPSRRDFFRRALGTGLTASALGCGGSGSSATPGPSAEPPPWRPDAGADMTKPDVGIPVGPVAGPPPDAGAKADGPGADTAPGQPPPLECTNDLAADSDDVYALAISPDGKKLAMAGRKGDLKIWELPSTRLLDKRLASTGYTNRLFYSRDGRVLGSAGSGDIRIWNPIDLSSRPLTGRLTMTTGILDPTVDGVIDGFALSADGQFAAAVTYRCIAHCWDLQTWAMTTFQFDGRYLSALLLTGDGGQLIAANDRGLQLFDRASATKVGGASTGGIGALALSHGERYLAAGSGGINHTGSQGSLTLYEMPGLTQVFSVSALPTMATALFSTDDGTLAVGCSDNSIRLFEVPSGKPLAMIPNAGPRIAAPGDLSWFVAARSRTVRLMDRGGKLLNCLFDRNAINSNSKAVQYEGMNAAGQVVTYTVPCGTPVPAGATCTCNCVAGTLAPPTTGGGGGGGCSCNTVCTCIPVCQAHKLLDPDPVVRRLAEQLLLTMGAKQRPYMTWAARTAPPATARRIETLMQEIAGGRRAQAEEWPGVEACAARLEHPDQVVRVLAAQSLGHVGDRPLTTDEESRRRSILARTPALAWWHRR